MITIMWIERNLSTSSIPKVVIVRLCTRSYPDASVQDDSLRHLDSYPVGQDEKMQDVERTTREEHRSVERKLPGIRFLFLYPSSTKESSANRVPSILFPILAGSYLAVAHLNVKNRSKADV
jgi:hypothetical protein